MAPVLTGNCSSHSRGIRILLRASLWVPWTCMALVHLSGHHFCPGVWFSNWYEESLYSKPSSSDH